MGYVYICKACGHETRVDEKKLAASGELFCERCLRRSGMSATANAPKRLDASLTPEQERAAYYRDGSGAVLVTGGAGTGKTRTLVARALYLHREVHVPAENIAILTFSSACAREITKRLNILAAGLGNKMFIGTFQRFFLQGMREFCASFPPRGYVGDDKLIDRDDQRVLLGRLRDGLDLPEDERKRLVPDVDELCRIFSCAARRMIDVEEYCRQNPPAHPETKALVVKLAGMYAKYKIEHHELDFDDILSETAHALDEAVSRKLAEDYEAFVKHPCDHEMFNLRRQVRKKYLHILVDGIQDAAPVHWAFLRAVCPSSSLFCTGDAAQSVCPAGDAGPENVRGFRRMFPGSVTLRLTGNFRSSQEIAAAANGLLKASGIEYDMPLTMHSGENCSGPKVYTFQSEQDEADFVLRSVRSKLETGVQPGEIMLLFRSADQAQVMERTLRAAGIPYRFLGGASFLQRPHVKDVFSSMEAMCDSRNEVAWRHFLGLHPGFGEKTVSRCFSAMQDEKERSRYRQCHTDRETAHFVMADKLERLNPKLSVFLQNGDRSFFGPAEQLEATITYFKRSKILKKRYGDDPEWTRDLRRLLSCAEQYEDRERHHFYPNSTERFIMDFKLDPDAMISACDRNTKAKLTLATVHGAKGLERDYCYLFRVQDGVFPPEKATTPEEIEEERRALYVAMTRARKQLIITQTDGKSCVYLTHALGRETDRRAI